VRRLYSDADRKLRFDGLLEALYLHLGRDETEGAGDPASGGDMLYALPGIRAYADNLTFGFGVKVPVWKDLNEQGLQQGAEGTENYRLIVTFSALF
jgi:hypothetical protein